MESLSVIREYVVGLILDLVTPVYRESVLEGFYVKVGTLKLQTFKKAYQCACCGREGVVFKLEATSEICAHLNLYAADGMLMCTDHIIPLSKGGPHRLFNTQTMCESCNRDKADLIQPYYFNQELKGWMRQRGLSAYKLRAFKACLKKENNGRNY